MLCVLNSLPMDSALKFAFISVNFQHHIASLVSLHEHSRVLVYHPDKDYGNDRPATANRSLEGYRYFQLGVDTCVLSQAGQYACSNAGECQKLCSIALEHDEGRLYFPNSCPSPKDYYPQSLSVSISHICAGAPDMLTLRRIVLSVLRRATAYAASQDIHLNLDAIRNGASELCMAKFGDSVTWDA